MGELLPLKGMHKKSISQKLLEITDAFDDRQVALMLADKCLVRTYKPYRFSINHDIRPPGNLGCKLHFDWARKDHVGIETSDKEAARRWLTRAARLGYTTQQMDANRKPVGFTHSIAIARRRAALHQMPKVDNDDDDIPF
jgi:hypothetical protein